MIESALPIQGQTGRSRKRQRLLVPMTTIVKRREQMMIDKKARSKKIWWRPVKWGASNTEEERGEDGGEEEEKEKEKEFRWHLLLGYFLLCRSTMMTPSRGFSATCCRVRDAWHAVFPDFPFCNNNRIGQIMGDVGFICIQGAFAGVESPPDNGIKRHTVSPNTPNIQKAS